jgi:hypothetical protein
VDNTSWKRLMGEDTHSVDAKTLQRLKNLAGFSANNLKKLADNLSVKTAAKNEIVFDQGDDAKLV